MARCINCFHYDDLNVKCNITNLGIDKASEHYCGSYIEVNGVVNKPVELSSDGGNKFDGGKLRLDLVPVELLETLADIYTYGTIKYDDDNWRDGLKFSRIMGAVLRHLFAWYHGEDVDHESKKLHLAHAFWNVGTLLYYNTYYKLYKKYDDRWVKGKKKGE